MRACGGVWWCLLMLLSLRRGLSRMMVLQHTRYLVQTSSDEDQLEIEGKAIDI